MLYTSSLSAFRKVERRLKPYFLDRKHGNDVVLPDSSELEQYGSGNLNWLGFKINYLTKLMRPEAEEWMKKVSNESIHQDVVLVSDEEDGERTYRMLLAERIINMFSGQMNICYGGELDK